MRLAKMDLILLLIVLGVLLAGAVQAEVDDQDKPLVTVTPYVGGAFFDTDLDLEDKFVWGGRLGWQALRHWRLEGNYGRIGSELASDAEVGVDVDHYGLDLMYEILPGKKLNPYLLAGWAQLNYDAADADLQHDLNGWEAALGLNWRLGGDNANNRSLRLEVRDVMTDLGDGYMVDGEYAHNMIASVGLQFGFGGSSKDTDGDGVRDGDDACADTPTGAVIDAAGCPVDSDGDGVFDGLDQCAGTVAGASVDAAGCPMDSDGDGVFDGLDQCAATPTGAVVDGSGCPIDSDGDGVFDGIDQCADTPSNLQVDMAGCPIAVTETEIQLLDTGRITTSQIVFASGSADLVTEHSVILEEIGTTLADWPTLRIEIGGHTDNTGGAGLNARLSEARASAVRNYLLNRHPDMDPERFSVKGYGEDNPVADNNTVEGRQANRRVEFTVLNTEALKKEIENRKLLQR